MSAMSAVSVCAGPMCYAGSFSNVCYVCYVCCVCMGMPSRVCIVYRIRGSVGCVCNVCYVSYVGSVCVGMSDYECLLCLLCLQCLYV